MEGSDVPVHFTRSALDVSPGQLIFDNSVIDSSVIARSSVLSFIAEAEGEARLPGRVTVSDFRQWLSAVEDSQDEFEDRPFKFMCTAIKVADAVDDQRLGEYIQVAASSLVRQALSSSAEQSTCKSDMSEALRLLTDDVQHRMFKAAACDRRQLAPLLNFLSPCFHAAVAAALISPEKMLQVSCDCASALAVTASLRLPASPPPVLALHMDDVTEIPEKEDWRQFFSTLPRALRHHTGLTSLVLHVSSCFVEYLTFLLKAIGAVTSLKSLELNGCCHFAPEHAPVLKKALRAMPGLQSLDLSLMAAKATELSGSKRQRNEEVQAPPPPCLPDMLSPATALTSLSLCALASGDRPLRSFFTAANALTLPHLLCLTANFSKDVRFAASFFANLSAPLTSLQIRGLQTLTPRCRGPDAAEHMQQLLRRLTAFRELRCFCAEFPTDGPGSQSSSMHDAIASDLPCPWTALQQLQSFSLAADLAIVSGSVVLLPLPALTQLSLAVYAPQNRFIAMQSGSVAWEPFAQALRQMLELQHLDLDIQSQCPDSFTAGALSRLSKLTSLCLRGWKCMRSAADGAALARMTGMQSLSLDHGDEDYELPHECIAAMSTLSALTALTLHTSADDARLVDGLVGKLPPECLPQLRRLDLSLANAGITADALVSYAAALPALDDLTLHFQPFFMFDPEASDEEEECRQHYSHVSALTRAAEVLEASAAGAGIKLRIHRDDLEELPPELR